jgi:hypothetical protein
VDDQIQPVVKKRERGGASFPCPECFGTTHVLTTRRKNGLVVRRRICLMCEHLVTTAEDKIAIR